MKIKFYKQGMTLILVASFIILSGCASIVSKSSYPILVSSMPSGAKITVKDKKGIDVYAGNTPATFKLKAGAGFFSKASYTVTFEMDGYDTKIIPVYCSIDGWYFGNLLLGGLLGMLIIDPATGAMWKLNTKFINGALIKSSASVDGPSLRIFSYNDIPEHWKENLVRIN